MTLLGLANESDVFGLLVRSSLLMGGAWISAATLQRAHASAATRHLAWLLGFGALLLLPLVWSLIPTLRLPVLPAEPAAPLAAVSAGPIEAPVTLLQPSEEADEGAWLILVYGVVAALLLARLLIARWTLARFWGWAHPAPGPEWEHILSRLCSELRVTRSVELRIARAPTMSMTWGTIAPKILLSSDATNWSAERRRLVLLHELAHVARRDSLSSSAASFACALYWFHPGAWYAARRMRIEQEQAADDLVLAAGAAPRSYALNLIDLAAQVGPGRSPMHAAAMAGRSQLEQRLLSIMGAARRERPRTAFVATSSAVALGSTLLVAATVPVGVEPTQRPSLTKPPAAPIAPFTAAPPEAAVPLQAASPASPPAPITHIVRPRNTSPALTETAAAQATAPTPSPPTYAEMAKVYAAQLAVYREQLQEHAQELLAWREAVEKLRREGNLGNTGNTGNTGNSGNWGSPGGNGAPPVPPTAPTAPTHVTWPTPLRPAGSAASWTPDVPWVPDVPWTPSRSSVPAVPVTPVQPAQGP